MGRVTEQVCQSEASLQQQRLNIVLSEIHRYKKHTKHMQQMPVSLKKHRYKIKRIEKKDHLSLS